MSAAAIRDAADPRFPIGPFVRPGPLSIAARSALANRIGDMALALRAAVSGLSEAQLDTPYREGGWSVRQVVHHLGDSHANALMRFKLALTEEHPTIRPYDENSWLHTPDVHATTLEQALGFVAEIQRRIHAIARAMTPAVGARTLLHPDSGELTVDELLAMYAWHGDHHVAHIRALRTSRGW